MKWMFEAEWSGEVKFIKQCRISPEFMPAKITHDKNTIVGVVEADDSEQVLDKIMAYMVENGDK